MSILILSWQMLAPNLLAQAATPASSSTAPTPIETCQSTREFIATYEFLKSKLSLVGTADQAAKISVDVASGCSGSAKRFIRTVEMLEKTELTMKDIVAAGVEMAKSTDVVAESFRRIFKKAYASDVFDLDYGSALALAKNLSSKFEGDAEKAMHDFDQVAEFCLSTKGLDLPKAECAKMSERVARIGQKYSEPAAGSFIQAYAYLTNTKTVGLTTGEGLKLAEEIIGKHPNGFSNFQIAFDYASSKSGLALPKDQAIKFASRMADLTLPQQK